MDVWEIITTGCFDEWFLAQEQALRESMYEAMGVLERYGPQLGRPWVDTLNNAAFPNLKELRVQHAGDPVRVLFIFDPKRRAIVLCAGNKTGRNEKRFYNDMIRLADSEYRQHLAQLEK